MLPQHFVSDALATSSSRYHRTSSCPCCTGRRCVQLIYAFHNEQLIATRMTGASAQSCRSGDSARNTSVLSRATSGSSGHYAITSRVLFTLLMVVSSASRTLRDVEPSTLPSTRHSTTRRVDCLSSKNHFAIDKICPKIAAMSFAVVVIMEWGLIEGNFSK